jgi:hypothetical protein
VKVQYESEWPKLQQGKTFHCVCDCHVGMPYFDCPVAAGLVTLANRRYPNAPMDEGIPIMQVYWCASCIAEAQLDTTWNEILTDTGNRIEEVK